MNLLIFKKAIVILFISIPIVSYSQPQKNDTIIINRDNQREVHVIKYYSMWNKLIPRYLKFQVAGSIGLVSLGTGWDYGKNKQWETDIFFGFLPKYSGNNNQVTFTLRQNFTPWQIKIKKSKFSYSPLSTGLYINTVIGSRYWSKEPDRHSDGYYTFANKLRFNLFLGQRFTYHIKEKKLKLIKSISFFYEVHTNDLYLIQATDNKHLKPKDYIFFSFGMKWQFL